MKENHPGAVPALGDKKFISSLRDARSKAISDAANVKNQADYAELMHSFAKSFSDDHISFRWTNKSNQMPTLPTLGGKVPSVQFSQNNKRVLIRLPALNAQAMTLVDQLNWQIPDPTRLEKIVIDVRGNTGGDSAIGDKLIVQLYGQSSLFWLRRSGNDCPILWRASPDNATWVEKVAEELRPTQPDRADGLGRVAVQIRDAISKRQPFSGPLPSACALSGRAQHLAKRDSPMNVEVLTDRACFSSCLIFVERLLQLGARQRGEATKGGNWYMEVRSVNLPSGLGVFTTLQKVDLRRSIQIGPFHPTN